MPQKHTAAIGRHIENQAANYLTSKGLQLLQKNFTCRTGEIDLILKDKQFLVFVEVRYRTSIQFCHPLETITRAKQKKIISAAKVFTTTHPAFRNYMTRFDVICATKKGESLAFEWISDAFQIQ